MRPQRVGQAVVVPRAKVLCGNPLSMAMDMGGRGAAPEVMFMG
jgi:hypothetical protein